VRRNASFWLRSQDSWPHAPMILIGEHTNDASVAWPGTARAPRLGGGDSGLALRPSIVGGRGGTQPGGLNTSCAATIRSTACGTVRPARGRAIRRGDQ
jgi:hypothetical protein